MVDGGGFGEAVGVDGDGVMAENSLVQPGLQMASSVIAGRMKSQPLCGGV